MIRSESYPLLKLSLFTHIIDARKQSKLKFKSVVCKQSKQPVFRHLNASFVITDIADSQIAERTSPLPRLEFGRQRKKNCVGQNSLRRNNYSKATWHVAQPPNI